jgi:hypothetical protein
MVFWTLTYICMYTVMFLTFVCLHFSNMLQHDFFPKIVTLFRTCKDLGDRDRLHMIVRLVKATSKYMYLVSIAIDYSAWHWPTDVVSDCAVLLNSPAIFEKIFSDDLILDIIGVLECKHYTLYLSFALYVSKLWNPVVFYTMTYL